MVDELSQALLCLFMVCVVHSCESHRAQQGDTDQEQLFRACIDMCCSVYSRVSGIGSIRLYKPDIITILVFYNPV